MKATLKDFDVLVSCDKRHAPEDETRHHEFKSCGPDAAASCDKHQDAKNENRHYSVVSFEGSAGHMA